MKQNTIIYDKGYEILHVKESLMFYSYENYPIEILNLDKVIGIVEIGQCDMKYHVLRNDKINTLTLFLDFNFFENKKRQRQLYFFLSF